MNRIMSKHEFIIGIISEDRFLIREETNFNPSVSVLSCCVHPMAVLKTMMTMISQRAMSIPEKILLK